MPSKLHSRRNPDLSPHTITNHDPMKGIGDKASDEPGPENKSESSWCIRSRGTTETCTWLVRLVGMRGFLPGQVD